MFAEPIVWPASLPRVNLFLVGGAKCGTTTLASFLSRQKDVCWSDIKEPWFFCQVDMGDIRKERKKTWSWYADRYLRWRGQAFLADGSVSYMYSSCAIPLIEKYNDQAKFIIMLRNPVDAVVSLHRQMLYNRQESIVDFVQAWNAQEARRNGERIPAKCANPKFLLYRDWCLWGRQMEFIFRHIPRKHVLIIFFDELCVVPHLVEKKLEAFLGITINSGLSKVRENAHSDPSRWSVVLDNVCASIGATHSVIQQGMNMVRNWLPVGTGRKTEQSTGVRSMLMESFSEDIDLLYRLTKSEYVKGWLE